MSVVQAQDYAAEDDTWERLVEVGREVVNTNWLLGDLADKVETKYGDSRLSEYARAVGCNPKTLMNARTVARAFPQKSRRQEFSFGAAQALASLPDRFQIMERNPGISVQDARTLARDRKAIGSSELSYTTAMDRAEAEGDPDYEAMIREVTRQIQRTGRELPAAYSDAFAEVLDKAANRARRKIKAAAREADRGSS